MIVTFDKVKAVLVEQGVDVTDIAPEASFVSMGLDSLEMAQLVLELEEEFGIEILDDDLSRILTPNNVIDYANTRCFAK